MLLRLIEADCATLQLDALDCAALARLCEDSALAMTSPDQEAERNIAETYTALFQSCQVAITAISGTSPCDEDLWRGELPGLDLTQLVPGAWSEEATIYQDRSK